jgi:phage regulator Rha-like protein
MSSKQIAAVVEKRHDNVKRTIETLANQGIISYPQIEDGEKAANGVFCQFGCSYRDRIRLVKHRIY